MTSILEFIDERDLGSLDDSERTVVEQAFHGACNDLRDARQPSRMYAKVATHIVEAVRSGERDPERARDRALTAFGRKSN